MDFNNAPRPRWLTATVCTICVYMQVLSISFRSFVTCIFKNYGILTVLIKILLMKTYFILENGLRHSSLIYWFRTKCLKKDMKSFGTIAMHMVSSLTVMFFSFFVVYKAKYFKLHLEWNFTSSVISNALSKGCQRFVI